MKLTGEQQLRIRELHGVCGNEACDKCGKSWPKFDSQSKINPADGVHVCVVMGRIESPNDLPGVKG